MRDQIPRPLSTPLVPIVATSLCVLVLTAIVPSARGRLPHMMVTLCLLFLAADPIATTLLGESRVEPYRPYFYFIVHSVFVASILCMVVVLTGFLTENNAADVLSRLLRVIGLAGRVYTSLALGGIGYGLYQLKIRMLHVYANAEIIFGLVSCVLAVNKIANEVSLSNIAVAVGSTYLIVRGLDNRQKAIEAKHEQEKTRQSHRMIHPSPRPVESDDLSPV